MKRIFLTALGLSLAIGSSCLVAMAEGKKMTVKGDVFDSACLFTKSLKKPISEKCAHMCAAGGSPLVVLGTDGNVYWPIDSQMPAKSQNAKLLPFGGMTVEMTGMVYERGGSRAIVIETVKKSK
jgi:hypothetical protein